MKKTSRKNRQLETEIESLKAENEVLKKLVRDLREQKKAAERQKEDIERKWKLLSQY